jgi:outer membrane cobalamin receptor
LLLDTDDWSEHGVVDVWQVSLSWSLSDSTEFIVDGSMAQANPSLVSSEIWNWNATQMSANG